MGQPFPNEKSLSIPEVIEVARNAAFEDFENTTGRTLQDYDYTQSANNGHILIARPRPGTAGGYWAFDVNDPNGPEWYENATYDTSTGSLDLSTCPQAPQPTALPAGQCTQCGANHIGPGSFCPLCGGTLTPGTAIHAPIGSLGQAVPAGPAPIPTPGQLAPGQSPAAGAGHQAMPAHINPHRMEGKPTKEVVIPPGMSVTKSTGFADDLDKLLSEAQTDDSK